MKRYIVALTGASGVIYGIRLVRELLDREFEVHLVASRAACIVLEQEQQWDFTSGYDNEMHRRFPDGKLIIHANSDLAAAIASGSFISEAMVVIPCTMAAVSAIAQGSSGNLIERAADVTLKEKRPLLIVPRETPLNTIHLRNMLALSEMGVQIIPAMPAFYQHPSTVEDMVDFVVGKVLDSMRIPHELFPRYGS